ncbi:MAG: precorrin-8X methylmutase [Clostridium sp.]|nr:precorrin-8X methylmutase [Clostridium sp.]MCM1547003.1 precorrin-8X methylmutase [Ruminococcus sp.]
MNIEHVKPDDIEKRSMEIIESELGDTSHLTDTEKTIVKRVIHTTADFDYLKNLKFSENAAEIGLQALLTGTVIITDTNMSLSGISKPALKALGCRAYCFTADSDVAESAKANGITRAVAAVDKAAKLYGQQKFIYAVGNAPTALIRLHELITQKKISPALIIGVPVGFVNVVYSKELIMTDNVPYIAAEGRKGGSTVAAAICNSLLYQLYKR